MKKSFIILTIVLLVFSSCENEKVVAPSTNFNIQRLDLVKNEYVNLTTPYELKVNQEYRLISENSSEYNSFYMGDSIKTNGKWIYHIYSAQPKSNFQGKPLAYNTDLKKSILTLKYSLTGTFTVTFVASSVGNYGDVVETAIKTSQITVIP